MGLLRIAPRGLLLLLLVAYTIYAIGPFLWLATMSLRTTVEINLDHYAFPSTLNWWKYGAVWIESNYSEYFLNSIIVVTASVLFLTIMAAMAGHCLARYRFPGNRFIFFLLFSSIMLPPQITIIALFQVMVGYGLFNSLTGVVLVYIAAQLPLTIFILENFFARLPQDLFDAAKIDGYSELEIFWRIALPISTPAVVTTVIMNYVLLWNEFLYALVLITDDAKRTLPLGVWKFMGDQFSDIGMVATGAMISILPMMLLYAIFSERIIQGMTAGAVK
jgi:ABC-type glycerol-3-phosphate transport system permease component